MAYIEGIPIHKIQLLTVEENPVLSGQIAMPVPKGQWSASLVLSHVRVSLAGPHGEDFGPVPSSAVERGFRTWEHDQHAQKAFQLIGQFLLGREVEESEFDAIAELMASAEQDVRDVFERTEVRHCLKALAIELKERGQISGSDIARMIESRIGDEQLHASGQDALPPLLISRRLICRDVAWSSI